MKKYTARDIAADLRARFLRKENLRASLDDTVINNLIEVFAEKTAEIVRYDEYLTKENNWDMMRNITSAVGDARMLGYQPRRKRSAIANLFFTVDPNILRIGGFSETTYQDTINEFGERVGYEVQPGIISFANLRSLYHFPGVSGTPEQPIPAGTRIKDEESDIEYITLDNASISGADNTLEEDKDPSSTSTSRWVRVAAIQGKRREVTLYGLKGREFERVDINSDKVENMTGPTANDFPSFAGLRVFVTPAGQPIVKNNTTMWTQVQDIREAGPYERAYSVETSLDYTRVSIVFGNGLSGRQLPPDSNVTVEYLETEGTAGNIDESNRLTTILRDINMVVDGSQLYVTNIAPIANGADEDTLADIKARAPQHYLTVDTIGSEEAYRSVIEAQPNIRTARVFRGTLRNNQEGIERDTVSFTAILEGGMNPDPSRILSDVRRAIGRRASPTDILQYHEPDRVSIAYNIQGFVNDVTRPLQYFITEVRRVLHEAYRIQNIDFRQSIYHIDVLTLLRTRIPALIQARAFPEARIQKDFYMSEFVENETGSVQIDFAFNTSLPPFRGIENDVEYLLRIDFEVPYTPLRHRSRTVLIVPNPDPQGLDDIYITRQFDLLTDVVLTPERTRAIFADVRNTYKEKTQTAWHWINRQELTEGEDFEYDEFDVPQAIGPLAVRLSEVVPQSYRLVEIQPDDPSEAPTVYLFYTDAVVIGEGDATEEFVLDYYNTHGEWRRRRWAQDPDVVAAFNDDPFFGQIPTAVAPDDTHMAPIEVTFNPRDTGGTQGGTGTLFIKPVEAGKTIFFIPGDEYRDAQENTTPRPSFIQILAIPRDLDLRLGDDFSIFDLESSHIKADLRYRTQFDTEFQMTFTNDEELD